MRRLEQSIAINDRGKRMPAAFFYSLSTRRLRSSRISSAMLVRESRTNSANGLPANASAMAEALPAPATMAVVPALAYAQGQRGAVRKALGTSKLIPRRRTQA